MTNSNNAFRGRGAAGNPKNRFELLSYAPDADSCRDEDSPSPKTQFFRDRSKSIIAYNDSPDIGFSASLNPYRGCEHGCIYCYARPTHEYLGFSAGLDFETKILVKEDAPDLLRNELRSQKWQPQVLALAGNTDVYQPIERKLEITRRCLEVLTEFRNPVGIVTKNRLVTRDIDLLKDLAEHNAICVFVSLTTLDEELQRKMEPRTSHPTARLAAIRQLSEAGIPVGVMTAPIIPGLNDHEIPALLQAAAEAGALSAGYTLLRLPHNLKELFTAWLDEHLPDCKEKVLNRIRQMRGGKLNATQFGNRMRGEGVMADAIKQLFDKSCATAGLKKGRLQLSTAAFRRSKYGQGDLFS